MANNNLLLIICIGIIVFWIINIKTTTITKKSAKIENYRNDTDDSKKSSSPLINSPISDDDLIQKLYKQNVRSSSTKSSTQLGQGILKTPPNDQNPAQLDKMYKDMAKQMVPDVQQKMYSKENPMGLMTAADSTYQSFDTDNYMLLPKGSMPDKKFDKVMPAQQRKTLTSNDLLPVDENKDWFQVPNSSFNLMQAVNLEVPEIKIGIDTVGQSRKNANYDLRVAPPCPKFVVSPWSNSTIEPDYNTKTLC